MTSRCRSFAVATALLITLGLGQVTVTAQSKPSTPATSTTAKKTPPAAAAKKELVDINTATRAQLETLPDVGDFFAQRIIDNRPYRAKEDLMNKNVMPPAHYRKLADMIVVKQPGKTTAPKK